MGVLDGKAIVVTGSGSGIGAACAIDAAEEGARVVVNDINRQRVEAVCSEIMRLGGTAIGHVADISVSKEAQALIDRSCDEFGSIDGLVNNAGLFVQDSVEDVKEDDMHSMIAVNLIGTVLCGQKAISRMLEQKSGRVVNMTSGSMMGQVGTSLYGATKGAVASLTYGWALDLEQTPIRVNAVSPYAESRMSCAADNYRARKGLAPRDHKMPSPRTTTPLVTFLLSDLSGNISGQIIRISGEKLNLMGHPTILCPTVVHERPTPTSIAEAFRCELAGYLQPLGNRFAKIEIVES
jgi:NAD(P)-dependent dehydrogenase (short-subunit alcohol dehydrogenase family)